MKKQDIYKFRCTIDSMYNNCPKPNGWFGCTAHTYAASPNIPSSIHLTGTFPYRNIAVSKRMVLDVEVQENSSSYGNSYDAIDIKIAIDNAPGLRAYLNALNMFSADEISKLVKAIGNSAEQIFTATDGVTIIQELNTDHNIGLSDEKIKKLYNSSLNIVNSKQSLVKKLFPEIATRQKAIERICAIFDDLTDLIKHPYDLLQVPKLTFPIVDSIALRIGIDPKSDMRMEYAVEYELSQSNGDLFINLSNDDEFVKLYKDICILLKLKTSLTPTDFASTISRISKSGGRIFIDKYNGENHLYLRNLFEAVCGVSEHIRSLKNICPVNADDSIKTVINTYEKMRHFKLTDEQRSAVINAVKYPMSIITGGPGRGKTTIIDCLIYTYEAVFKLTQSNVSTLLLAPTGKAMNKLRFSISYADYCPEIKTIDGLLTRIGITYPDPLKNEYNSPSTLIIIDESSMVDIAKVARVFNYFHKCRFCFIGDADQLPPIGPGAFFQDLLHANLDYIPVSRLTKSMRNKGIILENAEKVNNNDINLKFNITDMPFFVNDNDDDALPAIIDTYNDERNDYPDISDIALICPVRKGVIGTDNLNMEIQNIVCPERESACVTPIYDKRRGRYMITAKGYPISSARFGNTKRCTRLRIGDIVMNTKNKPNIETYQYTHNDYLNGNTIPYSLSYGIYNGDSGRIIAYIPPENNAAPRDDKESHEYMVIQLFDNRFVELDITDEEADNISLGYAMTVHKAQGSEYGSVIYVSPKQLLSLSTWVDGFICKNLVYTAFTRAKEKLTVIGSKDSLNVCISTNLRSYNDNLIDRLTK